MLIRAPQAFGTAVT